MIKNARHILIESTHHISMEYNDAAGDHIFSSFALDDATLRRAKIWLKKQKTPPTAEQFAYWLPRNGGKPYCKDGPAWIRIEKDGSKSEAWYNSKGFCSRVGFPASISSYANGTQIEEWYSEGHLHRMDGPAIIQTYRDGSGYKAWYRNGAFRADEFTLKNGKKIPGGFPRCDSPEP